MKFSSWKEVLEHAAQGKALFYQAPMDPRPVLLSIGVHPYGYVPRARTIRIYPPGSFGRGRMRTSDPFIADGKHLDRFSYELVVPYPPAMRGLVERARDGDREAALILADWIEEQTGKHPAEMEFRQNSITARRTRA